MSIALDMDQTFAPLSPDELANLAEAQPNDASQGECVMPVPADAPQPSFRHGRYGELSGLWTYRDASGEVLGYVVRFDPPGERKQFFPRTLWRDGDRLVWRWKHWPTPRPLYGLDRLAVAPGAPVVVVEGEKCADAAVQVFPRSVVVAASGGSNAAAKTDWGPLAGRKVLLWPDADEAGTTFADTVSDLLEEAGVADLRMVDAFALASRTQDGGTREPVAGWDVAEALDEGWPADTLRKAAVPPPEPKASFLSFGSYRMGRKGLYFDAGSDTGPVWLSGPFEILAATRDDAGSNWGLMLRWRDPDSREHSWSMPRSLLYGDGAALCSALAERGLPVAQVPRPAT